MDTEAAVQPAPADTIDIAQTAILVLIGAGIASLMLGSLSDTGNPPPADAGHNAPVSGRVPRLRKRRVKRIPRRQERQNDVLSPPANGRTAIDAPAGAKTEEGESEP